MNNEIKKLQEQIDVLEKNITTQKVRADRLVQVLLKNLPEDILNRPVYFKGKDCHGRERDWGCEKLEFDSLYNCSFVKRSNYTVRDFLVYVIDP